MSDYESDRRLFAAMRLAGWRHDPATGGFVKQEGVMCRSRPLRLWVSWQQAEDALRLADEGETAQGIVPLSESVARIVNSAANES